MTRPVIFLAFANQEPQPFLDLKEEDNAIYNVFLNGDNTDAFTIHRDQFTSSHNLISHLNKFRNQISIFHFGGHAGSAKLHLSDTSAWRGGLAAFLGKQKNLKCVFLNGCHTVELVDHLLQENVPVVIATDRAVGDEVAIQLADRFYTALVEEGQTIREAFEFARDAVRTTSDVAIDFRPRSLALRRDSPAAGPFPWGLYFNDEKALDWRLRQAVADVRNFSRNYRLRLAILIVAVFAIFSWSNWHFGVASTASFLALGPLALLGIASFFSRVFQRIAPSVSFFSDSFLAFFLKTPPLIAMALILTGIGLFGSSIVVQHEEGETLHMSILNREGETIPQWQISSGEEEKSRLFVLVRPFHRSLELKMEAYQSTPITLTPFLGKRLDASGLPVKAALLIRLQPDEIRLASRIRIRIECQAGEPILTESVDKASILIGPQRPILEPLRKKWVEELTDRGVAEKKLIDKFVHKWSHPNLGFPGYTFRAGERVKISKIMHDSVFYTKEVIIVNQKINDVLLKD